MTHTDTTTEGHTTPLLLETLVRSGHHRLQMDTITGKGKLAENGPSWSKIGNQTIP